MPEGRALSATQLHNQGDFGYTARVNDAGQLLREAGVRATAVRARVLTALLRAGCPVSQPELACLAELADCDRVTLYRTLKRLREAGLTHAVQGVDGSWRFCAHPPGAHRPGAQDCPGNHPHFLCVSCGAMICLTVQKLPRVDVPRGVRVQGKQLVVYGRCRACARRESAATREMGAGPAAVRALRGRRRTR